MSGVLSLVIIDRITYTLIAVIGQLWFNDCLTV